VVCTYRSQIQIASRTFHFVLPPPPPPEDTPSPSSQSSANRPRSPSVDITSISPPSSQPSHSPPPPEVKLPPPSPEPQAPPKPKPKAQPQPQPQPELPNSNAIGKSTKANSKKRKKSDVDPPPVLVRPKPEDMPPKPPFTYAQLIYRAIKDIGGKATLQEICTWIMNTHEYYKYADGSWMVRTLFWLVVFVLVDISKNRALCDITSPQGVHFSKASDVVEIEGKVSSGLSMRSFHRRWKSRNSRFSKRQRPPLRASFQTLQSLLRVGERIRALCWNPL